jgi:hypothetical protein
MHNITSTRTHTPRAQLEAARVALEGELSDRAPRASDHALEGCRIALLDPRDAGRVLAETKITRSPPPSLPY